MNGLDVHRTGVSEGVIHHVFEAWGCTPPQMWHAVVSRLVNPLATVAAGSYNSFLVFASAVCLVARLDTGLVTLLWSKLPKTT